VPKFLSHTWLEEAKAIRHSYVGQGVTPPHPMRMNLVITDVPDEVAADGGDGHIDGGSINAHMDSTGEELEMDTGHIDNPDLTVTLEYTTAKAILVEGNPAAGMQAFMAGKIKVQGDMTKLMAMQSASPDPVAVEIATKIQAMTD